MWSEKYNFPQNQKMKFRKIFLQTCLISLEQTNGLGAEEAQIDQLLFQKSKRNNEKNKWRGAFLNSIELI
ncbi:hypothetical protein LEP1GSC170_3297 [Leptospira interrogans serovar Bataviae str. HAI135]|nr:hypothetical protein LEP1GSC170_3297 [Leptospira interrogans serovar Bataviae str. HAI135]